MRMQGRPTSTNVRDLRGQRRTRVAGGLGLGGIVLVALLAYMTGGNPLDAVFKTVMSGGFGDAGASEQTVPRELTPEEKELDFFASQVLKGTEIVWKAIFAEMGRTYEEPTLSLFTDEVDSGCGGATKQTGPFYCSADRSVYLDLSFFTEMKDKLEADGDFAYAYVIGHEVGHHVQHLLGTLDEVHRKMELMDEKSANQMSVRLELQADFLAGVWAKHDNIRFASLEDGDIEEGIQCAEAIGDDHLQKKAWGTVQPETFTHGTSEARVEWFTKGYETGDLRAGDTFSVPFEELCSTEKIKGSR